MQTDQSRTALRSQRGFALIVLAAVVLSVGIVIVSQLPTKSGRETQHLDVTQERMATIKRALTVHFLKNGVLPCPAMRKVALQDADFGVAQAKTGVADECETPGFGQEVKRVAGTKVYLGVVPVRALDLSPRMALDGWGNRFTYAVDMAQVNDVVGSDDGRNDDDGLPIYKDLTVNDLAGEAVEDASGAEIADVMAVVVSHGQNGEGAFPKAGGSKILNLGAQSPTTGHPEYEADNALEQQQSSASKARDSSKIARKIYRENVSETTSEKENADDDSVFIHDKRSLNIITLNDDLLVLLTTCPAGQAWDNASACVDAEYQWKAGEWSACSGGAKSRTVVCLNSTTTTSSNEDILVNEGFCTLTKPSETEGC